MWGLIESIFLNNTFTQCIFDDAAGDKYNLLQGCDFFQNHFKKFFFSKETH